MPTAGFPRSRRGVVAVIAASAATEMPPSAPITARSTMTWYGAPVTDISATPTPIAMSDRSIMPLRP